MTDLADHGPGNVVRHVATTDDHDAPAKLRERGRRTTVVQRHIAKELYTTEDAGTVASCNGNHSRLLGTHVHLNAHEHANKQPNTHKVTHFYMDTYKYTHSYANLVTDCDTHKHRDRHANVHTHMVAHINMDTHVVSNSNTHHHRD